MENFPTKMFFCLPDGQRFKVPLKSSTLQLSDIMQTRDMLSKALNLYLAVEHPETGKEMTLILWGDVLKNSHVEIENTNL